MKFNGLFSSRKNVLQQRISLLGTFVGGLILLISVHYLIRIHKYGRQHAFFSDNTFLLKKKISALSTLRLASNTFNATEITTLKNASFSGNVAPVINNQFSVSIQTDSPLVPYFRSDIFLQSVPSNFIGKNNLSWEWHPQDRFVPVILPQSFLVMVNSYAQAHQLPPISTSIAKSIDLKLKIYDSKHHQFFKAKVIGFTAKIPSILVPQQFIQYGNRHFSTNQNKEITQVIVQVKKGKMGDFERYLSNNAITVDANNLFIGKLKSAAQLLFSMLIVLSGLIVLLAGFLNVQFTQFLFLFHRYSIQTLLRIGYQPKNIIRYFFQRSFFRYGAVFLFVLLAFWLAKYGIDTLFFENGIQIDNEISGGSFLTLIVTFGCIILADYRKMNKEIAKIQS